MDTASLDAQIAKLEKRLSVEQRRPRGFFETYWAGQLTFTLPEVTLNGSPYEGVYYRARLNHDFSKQVKNCVPLVIYWDYNTTDVNTRGLKYTYLAGMRDLIADDATTEIHYFDANSLKKSDGSWYDYVQFGWKTTRDSARTTKISSQKIDIIVAILYQNNPVDLTCMNKAPDDVDNSGSQPANIYVPTAQEFYTY